MPYPESIISTFDTVKKSNQYGAVIVTLLLLLQPAGVYMHVSEHDFSETSATDGLVVGTEEDGFCVHCFNFLTQSGDAEKQFSFAISHDLQVSYTLANQEHDISFHGSCFNRGPPAC